MSVLRRLPRKTKATTQTRINPTINAFRTVLMLLITSAPWSWKTETSAPGGNVLLISSSRARTRRITSNEFAP